MAASTLADGSTAAPALLSVHPARPDPFRHQAVPRGGRFPSASLSLGPGW